MRSSLLVLVIFSSTFSLSGCGSPDDSGEKPSDTVTDQPTSTETQESAEVATDNVSKPRRIHDSGALLGSWKLDATSEDFSATYSVVVADEEASILRINEEMKLHMKSGQLKGKTIAFTSTTRPR